MLTLAGTLLVWQSLKKKWRQTLESDSPSNRGTTISPKGKFPISVHPVNLQLQIMTLRRSPLGGGRLSSEYMHVIKMKQKAFSSKLLFSRVWMIALDAAVRGGTTSVTCMDAAESSLCLCLVCRLRRRPLVSFRLPEYLGSQMLVEEVFS